MRLFLRVIFVVILVLAFLLTPALNAGKAGITLTVDGATHLFSTVKTMPLEEFLSRADVDTRGAEIRGPRQVRAGDTVVVTHPRLLTLSVDGETETVQVNAATVGQALTALAVPVDQNTYIFPTVDTSIPVAGFGYPLTVSHSKTLIIHRQKHEQRIVTSQPTVGRALADAHIRLGQRVSLSVPLTTPITPNMVIRRRSHSGLTNEVTRSTILPVQEEQDSLLPAGTRVTETEGIPRRVMYTVQQRYVNGKLASSHTVSKTVINEGTAETDRVGVGPALALASPGSNQALAQSLMKNLYNWGPEQYACLDQLWTRESGWRVNAENPSSGAYGIPQSLPGDKMSSVGPDWRTNPETQIRWGLQYIAERYQNPCGAWSSSQHRGFY